MSAARWLVPLDHPAFAGHFPGRPIVPGVVLLDRVIQEVAAACGSQVIAIGNVKFLLPVAPGTALDIRWASDAGNGVRFTIACKDAAVASGVLTLAG